MESLKKKISLFFVGMLLVFSACQKENIPVFDSDERINFNYNAMKIQYEDGRYIDTIDVDMGFSPEDFATVNLEFILIGYKKEYDREIGLSITGDTDAVGSVLEIPEKIILPANAITVTVPCKIVKTEALKKNDKVFYFKLTDSKELLIGNRATLCFKAGADVPSVWKGDEKWSSNKIAQFFGECSKEKYRFVYSVLQVWNFSTWNGSGFSTNSGDANKFKPAKRLLKEELVKYETIHGPLVDPVKGRVTFPD